MKLVESFFMLVHGFVSSPWLGYHHHDRMWKRAPGQGEHLQRLIKIGGITSTRRDDGKKPFIIAKKVRLKHPFPGAHPVLVTPDSIDLSIMGDEPHRLCPSPRRKGIGAVP